MVFPYKNHKSLSLFFAFLKAFFLTFSICSKSTRIMLLLLIAEKGTYLRGLGAESA